ncbi:MAG: hypothetical protein J7647_22885 [Cyanobacteria bacterium SBLK]|nr:hypothetical protein [Cyanobacteria bacterium SBLK]
MNFKIVKALTRSLKPNNELARSQCKNVFKRDNFAMRYAVAKASYAIGDCINKLSNLAIVFAAIVPIVTKKQGWPVKPFLL